MERARGHFFIPIFDFDMAKIMRNAPTMDELDARLEDIQYMQEEFDEYRWERKDMIDQKMKGFA